ncbi:uncharacterized protein J7T54_003334 [Emericellopsis cladophorae]|uniref:Uncharacterized protein n=1 Tax=Emericellopsis cladophorae TaxID=2686198 RepID=A0A9P9XU56_9HYPO|nr:uncharacterized protein J7T54_003334 [Emericellopsis cladophorae]KAI6777600.1 hypothetical protein J7T54_003334 [Emericellopsis cladophorae]
MTTLHRRPVRPDIARIVADAWEQEPDSKDTLQATLLVILPRLRVFKAGHLGASLGRLLRRLAEDRDTGMLVYIPLQTLDTIHLRSLGTRAQEQDFAAAFFLPRLSEVLVFRWDRNQRWSDDSGRWDSPDPTEAQSTRLRALWPPTSTSSVQQIDVYTMRACDSITLAMLDCCQHLWVLRLEAFQLVQQDVTLLPASLVKLKATGDLDWHREDRMGIFLRNLLDGCGRSGYFTCLRYIDLLGADGMVSYSQWSLALMD